MILRDLSRRCKHAPWIPFDSAELKAVRAKWKNNKACGPDSTSYEALKILESTDYWRAKILYLMNDLLYVGDIPAAIERGITVLQNHQTKLVGGHAANNAQLGVTAYLLPAHHQPRLAPRTRAIAPPMEPQTSTRG